MTDKERIWQLEDALRRILVWCDAYPIEMFRPLSGDKLKLADKTLEGVGISMSRLHGTWGRHILQGVGDIIKMVLK